jgi:hypothetical protein
MLPELPPTFSATVESLHALAEKVLAAAYFQATTHIGLRPTPRGFGTPVFGEDERVRLDATALVHERAGQVRRHQCTTLTAAAAFVGVPLGAPSVFSPATTIAPDAPLSIDRDAALALADWYALGAALLHDVRTTHEGVSATDLQIWPEHFDLACELGDESAGTRANYGASPGDAGIPEPYFYVGPWDPARRVGALGTHGFGAALTYSELRAAGGEAGTVGRHFFETALAQLVGDEA